MEIRGYEINPQEQRQFCRKCFKSSLPAVTLTFDNGTRRLHWCAEHTDDAERYRPDSDTHDTAIRVEHRDGSVGILLAELNGVTAGPDTTGAPSVPVRWTSGVRYRSGNPNLSRSFSRTDMLVRVWSVNDPSFQIPLT